jgi:tRNA threonylcarbamoyl adenosine modification protein (Sua5/YciO/YrdC/YwlC family)
VTPIEQAVAYLQAGRVIGVPTDTVYGLAVDPQQPSAVEALFALKERDRDKPVGLLVADHLTAATWVELPDYAAPWTDRYWPGPLTLVGHPRRSLPEGVGDHQRHTVGIRVPDHPVIHELLVAFGPLAVTSANRSGGTETLDHQAARTVIGEAVVFYLPGRCPGAVASTVVDVTGEAPRVLRAGPLDLGL